MSQGSGWLCGELCLWNHFCFEYGRTSTIYANASARFEKRFPIGSVKHYAFSMNVTTKKRCDLKSTLFFSSYDETVLAVWDSSSAWYVYLTWRILLCLYRNILILVSRQKCLVLRQSVAWAKLPEVSSVKFTGFQRVGIQQCFFVQSTTVGSTGPVAVLY